MLDTTPASPHHRAQLLSLALGAQHGINLNDPADYRYLKGTRDAYVYAAAVVADGLGTRWGAQRDARLSHRRPHDGNGGLLYAHDQTCDEYAILADNIHADTFETARDAALDVDPHLPVDRLLHVLHDVRAWHLADVTAVDLGRVLR